MLLILTIVSAVPLAAWIGVYAFIPWGVLAAFTLYFAVQVEKVKKENAVYTYKEIVAFTEGRRLDEAETQQEFGKRPYQVAFLALGSAAFGFIIGCLMVKFFLL